MVVTKLEDAKLMKKYSKVFMEKKTEISVRFYRFQLRDGDFVWGIKRPHIDKFLDFCFSHFIVGIWSAGGKEYVEKVCAALFAGKKYKPAFIFSRPQCDEVTDEVTGKSDLWKPLRTVYRKFPDFNEKNTWFVDDNRDYAREDLLNWLGIGAFEAEIDEFSSKEDNQLHDMIGFLKGVMHEPNVQTVVHNWKGDEDSTEEEDSDVSEEDASEASEGEEAEQEQEQEEEEEQEEEQEAEEEAEEEESQEAEAEEEAEEAEEAEE